MKGEGECRGQVKVVRAWARVMLRAKGRVRVRAMSRAKATGAASGPE